MKNFRDDRRKYSINGQLTNVQEMFTPCHYVYNCYFRKPSFIFRWQGWRLSHKCCTDDRFFKRTLSLSKWKNMIYLSDFSQSYSSSRTLWSGRFCHHYINIDNAFLKVILFTKLSEIMYTMLKNTTLQNVIIV